MAGIGVVLNPKSRRNLRDPAAAARLARSVGDQGVVREARSIAELGSIADEFRRRSIDVLAISGGDGTNTVTLTGFIAVYGDAALPPVALLRGGTMNTVANSIGVRRSPPEVILARVAADYAQRGAAGLVALERDILRIAPATGGKADYGFLFGTGVVHGYLAEYYAAGEPSPLVAARVLAKATGSAVVGGAMIRRMAEPFRGSVTLEDGTLWPERDYLAIAAGTVPDIGLGFKPFYRSGERPGAFHVLGIHASAAAFAAELPRIYRSKPMREGKAFSAVSSRVRIRSARGPVRYTIDGDLHAHGDEADPSVDGRGAEVEIAVGPRIRLVR